MADDNSGLMKEFEEFLTQKAAREKEESENEDFPVEIWDKDGRGVRTSRSHAKPFLQTLGIDLDPEPETNDPDDGKAPKKTAKPTGPKATPANQSVRKYFAPKAK